MKKVELVKEGKSNWNIRQMSPQSRTSVWAAEELQKYIGQMTCARLEIKSEQQQDVILIGLRADVADDMQLPGPQKGYDGFSLVIDKDRIVIAGDNECGIVYGVYELLERLGCRWFYPDQDPNDCEVVPELKYLSLTMDSYSVASPIEYRISNATSFFFDIQPDIMKAQLDASMKARYNSMGWQCSHETYVGQQYDEMVRTGVIEELEKRGMFLHGPAHSFPHFLRDEDHFDENPEWFGMRDGKRVHQVYGGAQFCWSNAEARKVFVKNAEQFVLNSPVIKIFCTLGFDGGPACACPECEKSTPADLVFLLMNELVEALGKSAPEVKVETSGGYNPVHEPPEKTVADERLRIIWAHWGRHHGMGYDDDRYCWKENLETWRKAAKGGLSLCQYYTDNFATPWISGPYPKVMIGDRKYILEKNIDSIYMLMWPKGDWWNHWFNGYMAGRIFYDVTADPYDVIRDYAIHYYGPGAGAYLKDYLLQWAEEVELPYRVKECSTKRERKMLAEQRSKWMNPAVESAKDDPVYSYRVAKVERLHRTSEILTQAHRMHDEIIALRSEGDFETAGKMLQQAKDYTDQVIQHLHRVSDLQQGMIDKKEIPGFMTQKIKCWIEIEEKAIETRCSGELKQKVESPDDIPLPGVVTGE